VPAAMIAAFAVATTATAESVGLSARGGGRGGWGGGRDRGIRILT